MQFLAKDHNLKVVEVPITIRYVDKPKRNVVSHGFTVLNGILRLIAHHRPLLYFTVPGSFVLLVGALLGLWVVYNYNLHQQLAVGTSLLAVLLFVIGLLAAFTGILLHTLRLIAQEIKEEIKR
jgi:hypothetical protein